MAGDDLEGLVVTCERICVVLRTMGDELEAERDAEDPKVVMVRRVVRALEHELRKVSAAPFDDTPLPGATYIERLLVALEDPRGRPVPLVLRWLLRRTRESIVLVTEMSKALDVFGELELIDAAKRWLGRVTDGPGDDQASSE